jgi:hypothetical protein
MNKPVNPENKLLYQICQESFAQGNGKDVYLAISEFDFNQVLPQLPDMDIVLIGLFVIYWNRRRFQSRAYSLPPAGLKGKYRTVSASALLMPLILAAYFYMKPIPPNFIRS